MRASILFRFALIVVATWMTSCTTTPRQYWESLKGEGFPGWSESMAGGARADTKPAKPSGFFTDRRSEQIEKDLGGF